MTTPYDHDWEDFDAETMDRENFPYCECDNEPDEEESASNVCKSCGKLLS